LPVSVVRPLNLQKKNKAPKFRDPRFDAISGKLNEGLFQESYKFLFEDQKKERMQKL